MTHEEEVLAQRAVEYVKDNQKMLIEEFANLSVFKTSKTPFSVFMAGSPGAGKTEFSVRLIEEKIYKDKPVRIDADEIRKMFDGIGYNGKIHMFSEKLVLWE